MRLIDADALFEVIKKSMAENPHKEEMQRAMHIHEHKYFLTLLTTFPTIQPEERTEKRTKTHACVCISRQDAVELAMKYCPDDDGTIQCDGDIRELLDELENLPPVQPERKKGKWIQNDNGTYSCSLCHSWIPEEQHHYAQFCLYCGADMRGEEDG